MRVIVLRNPNSGRGEGRRHTDTLLRALAGARHEAVVFDVGRGASHNAEVAASLRTADAMILAGGDGTVHHSLPLLLESQTPIIHYPLGTENLFAREFGHTRNASTLLSVLDRRSVLRVDMGLCNDRPFVLMGSVGFDSCIVERIAAARTGGISRSTYVRHGLAEFIRPRFVPLTIHADGREVVSDRAGMVVIANSRQYAARLDPARDASMTDGELDLIFLPIDSRISVVRRGFQVITGSHLRSPTITRARARDFAIIPHADVPLQLDGEHAGVLPAGVALRFGVRAAAVGVLKG